MLNSKPPIPFDHLLEFKEQAYLVKNLMASTFGYKVSNFKALDIFAKVFEYENFSDVSMQSKSLTQTQTGPFLGIIYPTIFDKALNLYQIETNDKTDYQPLLIMCEFESIRKEISKTLKGMPVQIGGETNVLGEFIEPLKQSIAELYSHFERESASKIKYGVATYFFVKSPVILSYIGELYECYGHTSPEAIQQGAISKSTRMLFDSRSDQLRMLSVS